MRFVIEWIYQSSFDNKFISTCRYMARFVPISHINFFKYSNTNLLQAKDCHENECLLYKMIINLYLIRILLYLFNSILQNRNIFIIHFDVSSTKPLFLVIIIQLSFLVIFHIYSHLIRLMFNSLRSSDAIYLW